MVSCQIAALSRRGSRVRQLIGKTSRVTKVTSCCGHRASFHEVISISALLTPKLGRYCHIGHVRHHLISVKDNGTEGTKTDTAVRTEKRSRDWMMACFFWSHLPYVLGITAYFSENLGHSLARPSMADFECPKCRSSCRPRPKVFPLQLIGTSMDCPFFNLGSLSLLLIHPSKLHRLAHTRPTA